MNLEVFFNTLSDLKENRRLSSEAANVFEPFLGKNFLESFIFNSANSTFTSRLDNRYSRGKTVIAKFSDNDLECTILFPPTDDEWVDGLKHGDEFNCSVKVLELDNLYQRPVLGKIENTEVVREDVNNSASSENKTADQKEVENVSIDISGEMEVDEDKDEFSKNSKNLDVSSEGLKIETQQVHDQKKINLLKELADLNQSREQEPGVSPDEVVEITDSQIVEPQVAEIIEDFDPMKSGHDFFSWRANYMKNSNSNKFRTIDQLKDTYFVHIDDLERLQKKGLSNFKSGEGHSVDPINISSLREHGEDFYNWWKSFIKKDYSNKFLPIDDLEKKFLLHIKSRGNLKNTKNELADSKKNTGINKKNPPAIPSLDVQMKAKKMDREELMRIRDKKYDEGYDSLSKEEKEILSLSNVGRYANKGEDENKKLLTEGYRSVIGVGLLFLGMLFYGSSLRATGVICILAAGCILIPILKKHGDSYNSRD